MASSNNQGQVAAILGCVFGVLGILTIGIVFVPLAAICGLTALISGLSRRNVGTIALATISGILTVIGFIFSPSLWLLAAGILTGATSSESNQAPSPIAKTAASEAATSTNKPEPPLTIKNSLGDVAQYYESVGCYLSDRAVQKVDFESNGDSYYIVDEEKVECRTNQFCGSGGCSLSVYYPSNLGFVKVLDEFSQSYSIETHDNQRELVVFHKTIEPTRYRFERGCAVNTSSNSRLPCLSTD